MKRKIYAGLGTLIILLSTYYYWQNRYVELRPVIRKEYTSPLIVFQNDFYKIADSNEISLNYYKNIKYVMDRSGEDYIIKNGKIYIKYKIMNDMELIWNYTTRSTRPDWFKLKREMDSINGDDYKKVIYYK